MMVSIVFYLFIFYNVIVYVNCITQLYKKYLFLLFLNESKAKILFLTLSDTYFVLIISIFLILLFDREYLVIKHFLVSVSLLNCQKTMFLLNLDMIIPSQKSYKTNKTNSTCHLFITLNNIFLFLTQIRII